MEHITRLILKNCHQLLTCDVDRHDVLGVLYDCSVLIEDGVVKEIADYDFLADVYSDYKVIDCSTNIVLPGFVDAHTHTVFGGDRADEYVDQLVLNSVNKIKRNYQLKGLAKSIFETQSASKVELLESTLKKIDQMLLSGTTTVEIKSGYGIDFDTEIKQLEVIQLCKSYQAVDIYATYLGAHYWDTEMGKANYIDFMIKRVMPYIHQNKLADFCDIWIDDGYYTAEEAMRVLGKAFEYGMRPKMHTDCYSDVGGLAVAAKLNAVSADHLNFTDEKGVRLLAESGVVGVLLPGTDYCVAHPRPFNARKFLDGGVTVALATNMNPGNWVTSMPFIIDLACRKHQFEPEEAIVAATRGGAQALGIDEKVGSIKVGMRADIQIWQTDDYKDIVYKHGVNPVKTVIKDGKVVVDNCQIVDSRRKGIV